MKKNNLILFPFRENDHVSHRMIHVQFVSKIARTIGRALNLNEDLIEAIALGHDIGHTPLGHAGEAMLNRISLRELNEYFAHNVQSVRNLMYIEKAGKGLNLSVQVLDGIFTHNGEILEPIYKPMKKTKEEFLNMYNLAYKDLEASKKYSAMTLEGCVVRISDIIAYVGRDIEDAVRLGVIKEKSIPNEISQVLGETNKDIINKVILDIIQNSMNKPYIKLSDEVYKALLELKRFNYNNIYNKSLTKEELDYYESGMNRIYKEYLNDLENNNEDSKIVSEFLKDQSEEYKENTNNKRIVIDYIAGMTDTYFNNEIKRIKN